MSTAEELDMMNPMDEAQAVCYTCGKKGHFARNCLDKDKGKGAVRGGKTSSSKTKSAYLRTEDKEDSEESEDSEEDFLVIEPLYESPHGYVEDLLDETPCERNYRDEHDRYYVMQTLSDSEEEEEAKEALLGMELYKLSADGTEAIKSSNPSSARLPVYGCDFKDGNVRKGIIDSGATSVYVNDKLVKKLGPPVTKIAPRKVRIADKEVVAVHSYTTIDVKIGDLPVESVTTYLFLLDDIDLVLGLLWLQKHNPHMDWRTLSYEFTRNGRRYHLYPQKPAAKLRVAGPEEFNAFVEQNETQLLLIAPKFPSGGKVSEHSDPNSITNLPVSRTERRAILREEERMQKWIKRHCSNLLRPVGTPANLEPFKIDTGDAEPIKVPGRPYSPLDLEKIKEFIDENIANGIIKESESPWSAPLVLAAKADGTTRVCVDYRALNRVTKKDAYPLPRMDESFQKFHGARFFTILDLRSGYWQILLDLMTRAKTAFSTRYGHYEWLVLPFGVSNGPGGFQKRMNNLLLKFIDKFVIVYMDDILIFSKNLHEHIGHIRQVLLALAGANMILNIEKCKFFQTETRFLGHILSRHGSRPDPRNIEKVMAWPTPRTITDVRGFCNLAGHYRRYIPKFADMSLPLTDLMKGSPAKGAKIRWTGREEESFQQLKKALTSEPILRHPRMGQPFIIDPDSSQYCIGAVLQQSFQDPDGKTRLHPIAYESKKLTETEQRYATQEKELLAAKYTLNHWRHFVEGSEIHIRTDHESLRVYWTKRPMTKRLGKFMNEIEHYDPMIEYRPGRLQVVPDALSRIPGAREDGDPADTDCFTLMALDEADD